MLFGLLEAFFSQNNAVELASMSEALASSILSSQVVDGHGSLLLTLNNIVTL